MAAEAGSALIQQLDKRKGRYKMSISTTSVLHPFGLYTIENCGIKILFLTRYHIRRLLIKIMSKKV